MLATLAQTAQTSTATLKDANGRTVGTATLTRQAGDLPNLVTADGTGSFCGVDTRVTLATGPANSLFYADGTAIVIHAAANDEKTGPAGNGGARIACGIATAAHGTLPATGSDNIGMMGVVMAVQVVAGASLFVTGERMRRRG